MKRVDIFLQTYNDIDREIKKILNLNRHVSHMKALDIISKKNELIERNLDELKQYARLRNCLVHDTVSKFESPIAEPLPEVVENYKNILNKLRNPLTVYDICTHRSKILVATPNSKVIDVMHSMKELLISRVPILEDDRVIGVFNGNTLIYYLSDTKDCLITSNATIDNLMKHVSLNSHRKENFEFIGKKLNVYEAENNFKIKNKDDHKLIAQFITSDGTRKGRLLGILTEWDLSKI